MMSDNWELAFRKQVALDGHTIETLDNENAQLRARITEIEQREKSQAAKIERCEIEINELESEVFEKDKCLSNLEKQVESMRRCSNCANYIGSTGVCDDDYCGLGTDKEDACFHDNGKHWQPRGNDEG